MKLTSLARVLSLFLLSTCTLLAAEQPPNIILVMTDDQGWGEVGFHGNKVLKTPNLDRFAAEGTELTNFYVSPMCTPTRSSLMTGRYHFRTGAHDTFIGRSSMTPQETTIAEVFASAGYRTGIFGKWHLGENYPMRALDQGFQKVVVHGGGGIGQFADYPKNSYWNPTLLYNDTFKESKGYCTDVFMDESIRFIKDNRNQPFFCYVPLNIPHAPFVIGEEFHKPYEAHVVEKGRQWTTKIYGMITHFDGAFQRLLDAVEEMGLKENTIIIFMSDNGPNSVYYTAGLRARKGSVYENGFRSPFVIQWPKGMKGGRKFNDPVMHIDLLPTLADACGIQLPADLKVDGKSILRLLTGEVKELPERYLFMQHNRADVPDRYRNFMVRKGPFKVVQPVGSSFTPVPKNPRFELFNIDQDPGEKNDLAARHPEMVKDFVSQYEKWFDDVTAEMQRSKGVPYPYELNPIQKQDFRFTWQCWFGPKAHWKGTAYGRWMMSNPGLIKRFDVTIMPQRQHHGKAATVKFIWQEKTIERTYDQIPARVTLEDIELAEGKGFMEAQLHTGGKMWGVQEVQIKTHSANTTTQSSRTNAFPGKKTDFHGFDCYEFKTKGGVGIKVVAPKQAAPGKPWLWRSLFWKAIPLFWRADLELVKEGYHVVLVHGDVSGHPRGNANLDAAYDLLTKEYGFSKKCSMASMSRGTLSLFRWASANPEKVESIYVDNGVCNVKSWPAGKLVSGSGSKASGAPQSWKHLKSTYGFGSDEEALAAKISPIDLLEPLAKAGVPILMVCGNKDTAVPYEENDAIVEQRYKALGGPIKVIVEDKGHTHGMKDPTPVLRFIRHHTGSQ